MLFPLAPVACNATGRGIRRPRRRVRDCCGSNPHNLKALGRGDPVSQMRKDGPSRRLGLESGLRLVGGSAAYPAPVTTVSL